MIQLTLIAKTMDGRDAVDPEVTVDIVEVNGLKQHVVSKVLHGFNGRVTLQLADPDTFPMWQVSVRFSRFDAGAAFMFQPRGNPVYSHLFQIARIPSKWTPQFKALAALPSPRFDPFHRVVAGSNQVDLKNGPVVGDLPAKYDAMSGLPQVLAKAALLNLFAVLTDELDPIGNVPWFSYVRKFVRLDGERFVGEVDAGLFENVQTILNRLVSTYRAQGFYTEPTSGLALHLPNIPTAYNSDVNLVSMITVKKEYGQGNLQMTVSFLRVNGVAVHLLDCDMDEHHNIALHSFDLISHLFNGGTSPISMHEYIVEDSAQHSGGISAVDLGYELV